jgi:sulfate transport system substrate-binding protein
MEVKMRGKKFLVAGLVLSLSVGVLTGCGSKEKSNEVTITNVSYDPTRELYEAYNKEFAKYWEEKTGQIVTVTQSHGGSGKQARSVVEGNEADVVTLALAHDITAIENAGLIEKGWIDEFDKNSSPYTSTIVFLVRKGNPKSIVDWNDLVKEGVNVITPNPKTSGGACWNFLAAWGYADKQFAGDETKIKDFITALYKNVGVLDSGARAATTTFVENEQGDVLIAWENEAYLSVNEYPDKYEIVRPSISILAEPSVAIVDEVAKDRDTVEVSKAYLEYLYSDVGQRIAGDNYYRPSNPDILKEYADVFDLDIELINIDQFGGWDKAYADYFEDGAIFDQIYTQ